VDIFVRNLSKEVDEEDLRRAFEVYGEVTSVTLVTNKETGRLVGFGFVAMPSKEQAISAINALRGTLLKGQPLEFQDSRTRFERRRNSDRRSTTRGTPDRRSKERRKG
jgi:RNA recognition motif-containing protein